MKTAREIALESSELCNCPNHDLGCAAERFDGMRAIEDKIRELEAE